MVSPKHDSGLEHLKEYDQKWANEYKLSSPFPRFLAILERSRTQIRQGPGISHQDFWKEMCETSETPAIKKRRGGTSKKT